MNKIIAYFFFTIITFSTFSQNKKEQIEALNYSIDSLKQMIKTNDKNLNDKNSIILNYEAEIVKLNSSIKNLNTDLYKKNYELQKSLNEVVIINKNLQKIKDSLTNLNVNQKLDTLFWELSDVTWNQVEFDLKLFLPKEKFEIPINGVLVSKDKKIKIFFEYNFTDWMDQEEGNLLFYKEKDAIDFYTKGLTNLKIENVDGFVISGQNSTKDFIFVKGFYDDLYSMEGRDDGDPKWLWSNTIILKIVMNQFDAEEFVNLSEILNKGFNLNSIINK
jgi:hypothetical protein